MPRSLSDWLDWQQTLHPASIDLDLARVASLAKRLGLPAAAPPVLTVAGTNGKGSTVKLLAQLLRANGLRTGVYTSPHLRRYNERVRIAGRDADDAALIRAFEAVEQARAGDPLTYFEFGTLAALWLFAEASLDAWVLEVGLGGRLDAVNCIDPDVSVITTVGLDHQAWLGDSIEAIAAEKAGIMRPGRPALYGDEPVPAAVFETARRLGAQLAVAGVDYHADRTGDRWCWRGREVTLDNLALPAPGDDAQLRNASLALAALERLDATLLSPAAVATALAAPPPEGRFQRLAGRPEWLLDVAHNPQAAAVLAARCRTLAGVSQTSIVLGMLEDKSVAGVAEALASLAPARWITCTGTGSRALKAAALADRLRESGLSNVHAGGHVAEALELAVRSTPANGRIVVCGSFTVVGPALDWLGLY